MNIILRALVTLAPLLSLSAARASDPTLPDTVEAVWAGDTKTDPVQTLDGSVAADVESIPQDMQRRALAALVPVQRRTPNHADTCPTTACAADHVFGSGIGARLVVLMAKHNYNGSNIVKSGASPWSVEELDAVLAALADLDRPVGRGAARPLVRDDNIDRFRGALAITDPGKTLLALSSPDRRIGLRFGGAWSVLPAAHRRAAVLHELVHDVARGSDWQRGWTRVAAIDEVLARRRGLVTAYVSRYARVSIDEDMAESAVAYRYMPDMLRKRSPNRYALVRDLIFGGREFRACQSANAASSTCISAEGRLPQSSRFTRPAT